VTWERAPSRVAVGPREVHVWRFTLDPSAGFLDYLRTTLNESESLRAGRFRTETLRRRFVAGRGGLRIILGAYLVAPPGSVAFAYGEHGKPRLSDPTTLEFNLAHTHNLALCAVTALGAVGVDVEYDRPIENSERIVSRFFSPREQAEFLEVPGSERSGAFFRGWSRKEAFLKATGTGLATELDSFDVELGHGPGGLLRRVGDDPAEAERWSMFDVDAGPGFTAALAVAVPAGESVEFRFWKGLPVA
jgi:4'-phosphopantetheinyl transferase